jgi:hypothetical protein
MLNQRLLKKTFFSDLINTDSVTLKQRSFKIIIIINAIFFSGYYIIKCPLAYVLQKNGIDQVSSYSLASTANIIFSFCSLVFGFTLRDFKTQKIALLIGVLLSGLSIGLLSVGNYFLTKLAITCYVLGGSLYFFSITLLVNKQFDATNERLKGNFIYQIFVNFGGFIGSFLFYLELNNSHLFLYEAMVCLASFILLIINMKNIYDNKTSRLVMMNFFVLLCCLFVVIFFTLQYESSVRIVTVFFFFLAVLYILYASNRKKSYGLIKFVGLIFLFSVPYWMAYTFMYNEFFDFLSKDVDVIFGLSGNTLLLLNPAINMLFGLLTLTSFFSKRVSLHQYLNFGLFLILFAFLLIAISAKYSVTSINPIYPALSVILYSIAEFLIQSTLNSSVSDLLKTPEEQTIGLGMLRSSRAFSAAIAFYFMTYHEKTLAAHYSPHTEMQVAYYTYALFTVVLSIVFILSLCQSKKLLPN